MVEFDMDRLSKQRRSWLMSRVAGRDTSPERAVRRLLHSLGYRFRLHVRELPGKPDIVLAGRRSIIFVHGCFWHGHRCRKGRLPKSNLDFWRQRLQQIRHATVATLEFCGGKAGTFCLCGSANSKTSVGSKSESLTF